MFVATTRAFWTTAVCGSETVPVMVPRSLWANKAEDMTSAHRAPVILTENMTYNPFSLDGVGEAEADIITAGRDSVISLTGVFSRL